MMIECTNCHRPYPEVGVPYQCPTCGGLFDLDPLPTFDPGKVEPGLPGIWRYRHTFGLPAGAPVLSLGEGRTPLILSQAFGRQVALKCEYLNPTGSFKDRGSAPILSFLCARGVQAALEDSSGNAGASFAAYSARAGIKARVFVPDSASGPKRLQIEAYGAELVRIMGPRSNAAEAVRRAAAGGAVYASHAYLPHNLPGYATLAYELFEQLSGPPGTVIVPVGQGGLLLGIGRGFASLQSAGLISRLPRLVGVQARLCAPLWALFSFGAAGLGWAAEGATLAEGIRVRSPLRGDALLQKIAESGGTVLAVDEEEILPGQAALARGGFYVEPTSAVVWGALHALFAGSLDTPEPVVVVLTGSGFKYRPV
jgi:threonine synthase